jgi:hypothetical protein
MSCTVGCVRARVYRHTQTYDGSRYGRGRQRAWAAVNCQCETRFEYVIFNVKGH